MKPELKAPTFLRNLLGAIFFCAAIWDTVAAAPFALSDSDPNSPEFRRRFLANHGVNEAIEPRLSMADRPLQEAILPHIRDNPKTAIQLIEQDLTAETNPAFLGILGNLYYQVDDHAAAERYLKQTVEEFPTLRRSWRTLALTYVQRNMFQAAVPPLLKVIELGGGDAQSYGLLAYCHLTNQKHESALAAYRMARMFKPDSLDFRRGQAQCLLVTHQHRSAIALFDELIAEHPRESKFWLAQANAYIALDRPDEAIANLEIVADSGKATWTSLLMLGDLYLNQDVPQLALAAYRRAVRDAKPADWAAALRPLNHLIGRRQFREAKEYLTLIRSQVAGPLDTRTKRKLRVSEAHIEMAIGEAGKAFKILEQAVREDPLDAPSLILLGDYYQRIADYEKAEFHFERATSVSEHAPDAYVALGRLAVERGNLKAALLPLRKAQQLRPGANVQRYIESVERAIDAGR